MRRVTVREDPELAAAYPLRRMARLRVVLRDGREFSHFQQSRKGDPENPFSDNELIAKYEELASEVLNPNEIMTLRDTILQGLTLPGALSFKKL